MSIRFKSAVFLLLVGLGLSVVACGDDDDKGGKDKKRVSASTPVEVVPIERGPIATYEVASGRIDAQVRAQVFARVSEVCAEIRVVEGQTVKANDVLAVLEDDEYRFQRDQALASREKANQRVNEATIERDKSLADFERIQRLVEEEGEQGIYSKNDLADALLEYDKAEIALKVADEDYKRAQAESDAAELRYQNTFVRSPIDGIVVLIDVELYDLVKVDQRLFSVAQLGALEIEVDIPESSASEIRATPLLEDGSPDLSQAQAALLYASAYPETRFLGYVEAVAPIVDSERGMVRVTLRVSMPDVIIGNQRYQPLLAQFPPPERRALERSAREVVAMNIDYVLRPGMWVQASIVRSVKHDTLLLPSACVVNGAIYLLKDAQADESKAPAKKNKKKATEQSDGTEVRRIDVLSQRGIRNDKFTELLPRGKDGKFLKEGALVVVRGQDFLRDGSSVSVVEGNQAPKMPSQ